MRALLLTVAMAAGPALAQAWLGVGVHGGASQGAWTGYVGGFKAVGQPSSGTWTGYVGGFQSSFPGPVVLPPMGYRPVRAPYVPYVVGPTWVGSLPSSEEQERADRAAAAQREWALAESARIEREQNERRLAEERQRAAEERQRVAEERQRAAEERERAAQERLVNEQALAAQRALIELQKAELEKKAAEERAAPPKPTEPPSPGNDVYRWEDDEGVVHYSTRVPPDMTSRATMVGGKAKR